MNENKYEPLVKEIIIKNKTELLCSRDGTSLCQLHNHCCQNCPMFKAIIKQLYCFEQIYLDNKSEEELIQILE